MKFELARAAEDPQRWRAEAHSLRSASRLLLAHWLETPGSAGGVAFPAMMLAGYAIEDFAKARILELGETWDRTRGHDLPWLVAKAGIPTDWAEDELLRRLKQIVTWAGRYPTPLNLSDATPWPKQASDADFKRIDQIYERLRVPVERLEERSRTSTETSTTSVTEARIRRALRYAPGYTRDAGPCLRVL